MLERSAGDLNLFTWILEKRLNSLDSFGKKPRRLMHEEYEQACEPEFDQNGQRVAEPLLRGPLCRASFYNVVRSFNFRRGKNFLTAVNYVVG